MAIDVDQLIKDALAEGEVKELTNAERFVAEFVEASDTEWVHGQIIFWKYLHWFYDNDIGETPTWREEFFKLAMTRFKKKTHCTLGNFYGVKETDLFKISKDEYRLMRGHLRDERQEKKRLKKWRIGWKKYKERLAKLNGNEKKQD